MHPLICDVPGLADLLKISTTSAARRAREGTVPGVKIGREWRFWVPPVVEMVAGTAGARADEARAAVPMPDMVHAEELAELLGVHATTLRLLFRQGRVPGAGSPGRRDVGGPLADGVPLDRLRRSAGSVGRRPRGG